MSPETESAPAETSAPVEIDPIDAMLDQALTDVGAPPSEDLTPDLQAEGQEESDEQGKPKEPKATPAKRPPQRPQGSDSSKIKGLEKGFTRLSQQNAELLREVKRLQEKDHPTYEPEQSREQIESTARRAALTEASVSRANAEYGEEYVQEQIFAEGSPYRQLVADHPWVYNRVNNSPDPAYEALQVIQEQTFFETYGRDPDAIKKKLKEQIKAELQKEIKSGKIPVGAKPPSLNGARVASTESNGAVSADVDLNALNPSLASIV